MRKENNIRLLKGLITGIIFGFLLQRGGVTSYNVIVGQLMLDDFTVVKIILTAIIVGMVGIYALYDLDKIELSPKNHSLRRVIPGGLIFGVGFALLGYCPGTIAGAVGQGSLDALIPGLAGIIIGSGLYALFHEKFGEFFDRGRLEKPRLPDYLGVNHWKVIIPAVIILALVLISLEML